MCIQGFGRTGENGSTELGAVAVDNVPSRGESQMSAYQEEE
jgi:hypothetical protein